MERKLIQHRMYCFGRLRILWKASGTGFFEQKN